MGSSPLVNRCRKLGYSLLLAGFLALTALLFATPLTSKASAAAGINQQMNFQGRLYNTAGNVVPDGYYNLEFKIYQDGDGLSTGDTTGSPAGTLKWTEDWLNANSQGVRVQNGFLSVQLGSINPFGSSIDWNQDTLWLSMNIASTGPSCTPFSACTPDGEMLPMKRMSATAYALNAQNANTLNGKNAGDFVQNTTSAALQTNTSLAIQSSNDANETAYLQGRTSQSAATLSIKTGSSQTGEAIKVVDGSNNPLLTLSSSGQLAVSGDSTFSAKLGIGNAAVAGDQLYVKAASGNVGVQVDNNGTQTTGIFKSTNTSGTQTDGLVVDRNGAGGTTTNGINVTNTSGTLTNGLAFNGTIGTDITRTSGTLSANGAAGINLQTNGTTRATFDTTGKLYVGNGITAATTGTFTLQGSTGAASNAGFTVAIQGGTSGTGAVNGGDVLLQGGTSGGSGVQGQVKIANGGFITATAQNFTASGSVTQANVDNFSSIEITSSGGGPWTATVPAPTTKYNGRLLYLQISTISGATTISISPSGGNTITMSPSTGVTLIWNTTINAGAGGWLNAGADSGSNSYIQNQSAADQAASFRISGTAIAPTFKSKDSAGSSNSDNLVLKSGDANTGSNNSSGTVTIKSGDATGGNASSGSLFLDVGSKTGSGTTGSINIGTNATNTVNGINIGKLTVTTVNQGNLTLGGSAGSGTTFTNNGATVNTALAVANDTDGGVLGGGLTAAQSVDIYTSFTVNQTTGSQTITIPSPTSTAAGRIIYIANIGSVSIGLLGSTLNNGSTASLLWNGSAWTFAGADGTSINNQKTAAQNGDFWIQAAGGSTGIGRADGGLQSPNLERATSGTLSLGTTANTTALTLGSLGVTTSNVGNLTLGGSAGSGTTFTNNGATVNTALAVLNDTNGGVLGGGLTAAQSVDIYTSFTVNQTTASQTITIPSPTNTAAGRIIYIANIGSVSFGLLGSTLNNGSTATLLWNGSAWTFAGADGTSINNQNAAGQNGDFWIQAGGSSTGVGRADGGFVGPSFERATSGTLSIGTTANTTALTLGSVGVTTTNLGNLTLGGSLGSGTTFTNNGATLNGTKAVLNDSDGGSLGGTPGTPLTAAQSVDIYTSFTVNQTTASQTITIPSPTNTAAGRIIYIANIGSVSFGLLSSTLNAGATATLLWNGSAWTFAGVDGSSVNTIGTFSNTSIANGGSISGTTLTFGAADQTNPGMVSTGDQTFAGNKTFQNTNAHGDSTTALNVKKTAAAGGTSVFDVDTTNGRIGVNNAAPGYAVDVNGSVNVTTGNSYKINGTDICTASGCTAASGSSYYIQNTTSPQTADFNITGTGTIGGAFTANGTVLFKNATDSVAAYQMQNAAGTPILLVDTTTNNYITNPSFEPGIAGWAVTGAGSYAQHSTAANVYHGNNSLAMTTTVAANDGVRVNTFTASPTFATSATWNFSVYAKLASGTLTAFQLGYNIGGGDVTCATGQTVVTGGFTRYTCTITLTSGQTISSLFVRQSDTTARTVYIDAVQLITGSTSMPYQVGNVQLGGVVSSPVTFRSAADSTTAFQVQNAAGTANNLVVDTLNSIVYLNSSVRVNNANYGALLNVGGSTAVRANNTLAFQVQNTNATSIFTVDTIAPTANLITNPGFELGTNNALPTSWTNKGTGALTKQITPASGLYSGTSLGQLITGTSANNGASFAVAQTLATTYNLSFYARASTGTATGINFGYTNSGGDQDCATNQSISSSGFTRFTCSYTVSGTAGTAIYLKQTGTSTQTIYLDGFQLLASATAPTPYALGTLQLRGTITSPTAFQNSTDSTTAFQVQNASGTSNLFVADTLNGKLGVGMVPSASGALLQVGGTANITGATTVGSTVTASNTTAQQVTVGTDGSNAAVQFGSGSDTKLYRIGTGQLAVKPSSGNDSTAAFQVQNAAGNQIASFDTSGNQLILGKAGASGITGKLTFQNATNANTVSIQSGTTSTSYSLTLPTALGSTNDCLKDTGSGVLGFSSCSNGVNTIGTFSNTSIANGGSISGTTLTFGAADGTNPGMVSTGTQTFAGDKTFQSSANSVTALNVKKTVASGGASVFDVDTTNGRVGINNAAPSYELDVTGSARFTATAIAGTSVLSPLVDTVSGGTTFGLGTNNATSVSIAKTGVTTTIGGVLAIQDGTNSAPGLAFNSQATLGIYKVASNVLGLTTPTGGSIAAVVNNQQQAVLNAAGATVASGGCYNFSGTANDASAAADASLCRDGANAIGQRNGANAQTLSIYNTYTSGSAYERASLGFSSNVFNIDTAAAGGGTARAISIGGTNATTVSVGGVAATTVNIGAQSGTATVQLNLGTNNTSGSTTNVTLGAGSSATGGTTAIQSKGNTTISTNGTTRATFDTSNSMYLGPGVTSGAPGTFTVQATSSNTTAVAGGILQVQGGNATTGNANGGNLQLLGGTGVGTGVSGLVVISTPTFQLASGGTQTCSGSATTLAITQTSVDSNGVISVGSTSSAACVISLPDPTNTTAGRIVYVSASSGSTSDFTLSVNGGVGTGSIIAMRANTTATMVWNGSDWTAAGASSSTTLQSAYDNTLQSSGGAELVVSKTSATNGLTIRDSAVNPVNGALLAVQSSSAATLMSVSSNVTEYASDAGAEIPLSTASPSSFPANSWSAGPAGGATITRYTTAGAYIANGTASVQTVTTATAGAGAKNQLSSALITNNHYNVSFSTRLLSGTFTDMDVYYSIDGTANSVLCTSAQAVKTSINTKINCAFTAPSSGITTGNAIFIRQTTGVARTFYIDNLSVTIAADYNLATDGSVDDSGNFGTNWPANAAGGTVTRDTTIGYDASSSAKVVTAATAGQGVRNKLSIKPQASTASSSYLYRVTAYVATTTSGFNNFTITYSLDGSTTAGQTTACVDYNTQAIANSTTTFTKVTCYITTSTTAPTTPYVLFAQGDATARTFYVDAFSMTLASSTTPTVQIGGGTNGGPTTLFTLDRGASAPIAGDNESLLGSMYYDTTLGKLQCYEADGWGACGSSPDNIVTISPEYTNAVMHGTGVGTMVSDFCSSTSGININDGTSSQPTICGANETYNFYKWTSPQSSAQTYSIYVTYQLPTTFKAFASGQTSIAARVDNTSNASVKLQIYKNASGNALTACGSNITVTTSANTWQSPAATGTADPSTCGFTGGNSIVFKITMSANSNANAYIGNLNFTFSNK